MKNQDVFRWYYKETLDKFEPYHCKARIAIFNGEVLYDIFWGKQPHNNHWFNSEDIDNLIELEYLGNLLDFEPARKSDRAMYNDVDFLDLNHSNNSRGNYYLRKGAVKSKEKMVKIIKRNAVKLKSDYEYAKVAYESEIDKLNDINTIEYVFAKDGVSLADDSYEDELFKGE